MNSVNSVEISVTVTTQLEITHKIFKTNLLCYDPKRGPKKIETGGPRNEHSAEQATVGSCS